MDFCPFRTAVRAVSNTASAAITGFLITAFAFGVTIAFGAGFSDRRSTFGRTGGTVLVVSCTGAGICGAAGVNESAWGSDTASRTAVGRDGKFTNSKSLSNRCDIVLTGNIVSNDATAPPCNNTAVNRAKAYSRGSRAVVIDSVVMINPRLL
jgi:hypothetical protein